MLQFVVVVLLDVEDDEDLRQEVLRDDDRVLASRSGSGEEDPPGRADVLASRSRHTFCQHAPACGRTNNSSQIDCADFAVTPLITDSIAATVASEGFLQRRITLLRSSSRNVAGTDSGDDSPASFVLLVSFSG